MARQQRRTSKNVPRETKAVKKGKVKGAKPKTSALITDSNIVLTEFLGQSEKPEIVDLRAPAPRVIVSEFIQCAKKPEVIDLNSTSSLIECLNSSS